MVKRDLEEWSQEEDAYEGQWKGRVKEASKERSMGKKIEDASANKMWKKKQYRGRRRKNA
jgi:hypothetical protein